MQAFRNLIGGQWVDASDASVFEDRNPAQTDDVIGTFPRATSEDVQRAIAAAVEAQRQWSATPPPQRGEVLHRASHLIEARLDEMAAILTREEGKTLPEAKGEVRRARDIFRFYAGEGWRVGGDILPSNTTGELLYTRREPLGVVSVITPWNFPVAIPAWKIAPALIYGNAVLFKPASYAPHIGLALVECVVEAGLPGGVLSFLTGSGSVVGKEMTVSPQIDGISFTGSYQVGTRIYQDAIPNMTRVQLEMGGKNPLVVLRDADVELAVQLAVKSGFGVTGQSCTAASRVIVEDAIADRFAGELVQAARALQVGNGLDPDTDMGPAVSQAQQDQDLRYVQVGLDEGATLLTGGQATGNKGFYVQPTVFDQVEPQMRIAQEEIFGPVIGLMRARDFEDAMVKASAIGYGLAASIVTQDLQRAFVFANRIDAGVVKVNEPTVGLALQAPFGGFKLSSANTFKEQGQAAIEFYTRTKTIYVQHG